MSTNGKERVIQKDAATRIGKTAQAIGIWMKRPGAPVEIVGGKTYCVWPDFPNWREKELEKQVRSESRQEDRPTELNEAVLRRAIADAVIAELAAAEKERTQLHVGVHEEVVGTLCDRLRGALVNMPSNYAVELERAGVPADQAQAILERISEDLTATLRASVEEDDGDL